ncbi:MAG: glycosyltransferase [Methyloprofundus sp.]|nr:glycosyltransferase [Methyloprofundus sp.]
MTTAQPSLDLSIIVPVYNEELNLPTLVERIYTATRPLGKSVEIILIDDGSSDDSVRILHELCAEVPELTAVILSRNYGQSAAMSAGFHHAQGHIIISMDGDLQNDPADIPLLLAKLDEGYDVVCGWRKDRQDGYANRVLPSKIANWLIGKMTNVRLHDYGCSLKAYRYEFVKHLTLYGELHRFIPVLVSLDGAKITEIPVNHSPRLLGESKYGIGRTPRVILDLILMFYFQRFATRPLHFFGKSGLLLGLAGGGIELYLAFVKLGLGQDIGDRPLLILGFMLMVSGMLLIAIGILAELIVRVYHESSDTDTYRVREHITPQIIK